jgi:hypothetical protein
MDTRVRLSSQENENADRGIFAADDYESLEHRLEAFARRPNVDDLDALISEWHRYADRSDAIERIALYARLAIRVRRGELPAWALMPVLLGDVDRDIVAAAATTVALSHRPDAAGPDKGPFCVLDHLLTPRTRNAGAGLGALLGLGDAQVADVIYALRTMLSCPQLSTVLDEMLASSTGLLHRATIEFYLNWLEELGANLPGSADLFLRVASGLARQRSGCSADFVIDGRPRYPALIDGPVYENGWCIIPLDEYTRSIASRLAALQQAAVSLPVPPEIEGPWGFRQDPGAADPGSD